MSEGAEISKFPKWVLPLTLAFIGSGFSGAWLSSMYSEQIAKREITANLLEIISKSILQTSSVPTNLAEATNEQLSVLLSQKEQAFLTRKMTGFLKTNYPKIEFKELLPALNSVQTRYSYARIYQAAGMVDIICENLSFADPGWNELTLSSATGKCSKEAVQFLDGVKLKRLDFDWANQKFDIQIENDYGNILCHQRTRKDTNCSFSVDLTDRLENLPYEYMIITEYMGFIDSPENSQSVVNFSIVKKIDKKDFDRSYWDYDLDVVSDRDTGDQCADFFDHEESSIASPSPPALDTFDRMVLRACGSIKGSVTRKEFKQLLSDFYDTLWAQPNLVSSEVRALEKVQVINELHRLWTLYGGFDHVFCGDWDRGSIGGFHFVGRYLQLQMEGQACYVESTKEDIKENYVYTIGAQSVDGRNQHAIKGYSFNRSAFKLFTLATSVFYKHLNTSDGWKKKSDLWEKNLFVNVVENDQTITYRVLVQASHPDNKRTYGIKTIYPDLTPDNGYDLVELIE